MHRPWAFKLWEKSSLQEFKCWKNLIAYFKFIIHSPPVSSEACPGDPSPCRTFVLGVFSPATPSSVSIHCIPFPSLPTERLASAESEHNFQ